MRSISSSDQSTVARKQTNVQQCNHTADLLVDKNSDNMEAINEEDSAKNESKQQLINQVVVEEETSSNKSKR